MSTLADLLRNGSDAFNAKRENGALPSDFSGSTLSGLFFAQANFSGLDLSNVEIEHCTIGGVDFSDANLEGAYVHDTRFERCVQAALGGGQPLTPTLSPVGGEGVRE